MKLAVNGWRILGQRTGVGRYLLNILREWDAALVKGRFDEIELFTHTPLRPDPGIPSNIGRRVLGPDWRMLLWENLRFGPGVKADAIFCPSYSRPLVARGKTVVTIFEATLKLYPHLFPRAHWYSRPEFYLNLYEWSGKNSVFVITTTESAKEDIRRAYGIPEEKIRVVYIAPPDIFRPIRDEAALAEVRRRYLGEDSPFFLFVGKMTPRRNVPKLIQAFAELKRESNIPHKLLVIGKNETGLDVEGMVREAGIKDNFAHHLYISDDDLVLLYNAATAFVLPYTYEAGASLTTLEAQATGCPVITMDSPGLRENSGNVAYYLRAAEVADIKQAMRDLGDEALRKFLSEQGLAFASGFSWRRTADETLSILHEAAHS